MSPDELDRIIAALKAGKRFSILGADGEWGFEHQPDGRFRSWMHAPYEETPDELVSEASVRASLGAFDYERIARRLW